jgi:tripartite-type tricarboxylate transporter receptor subunit TctC
MLNLKPSRRWRSPRQYRWPRQRARMAFPDKPIEYIIPFGPGGESDISARFQQPFFKDKFGQDLVVSYKPGGGGAVGWAQLEFDGRRWIHHHGHQPAAHRHQPAQKDVGYTTEDINAFYMFHYTPDAIVVTADSPYQTLGPDRRRQGQSRCTDHVRLRQGHGQSSGADPL